MKKIIAISGSLREKSFNTALLHALQQMETGTEITIKEIDNLPLFNEDLEVNFPKEAQELKDAILSADGIIIATPEYNRSIPGVLKNAIDWVSRPYGKNALANKPVLTIGATVGPIGTAVAQSHLRQVLLYLDANVVGQPEIYVSSTQTKVDGEGAITDESTKQHLKKGLDVLLSRIG